MQKLEKDKLTILPHITGPMHLCVLGEGTVKLLKSINGRRAESFYACTDSAGEHVHFSDDQGYRVLFNSEIVNNNKNVHYALVLSEGTAEYKAVI